MKYRASAENAGSSYCKRQRQQGRGQEHGAEWRICLTRGVEPGLKAGCVVCPQIDGSSVWIVGHSFVRWAAKQAKSRFFQSPVGPR
ncbi:hypothetical protein NDU88_004574 [Pleurodeles waltl]|uniref:Uncharacterized protein n=1 Tax=Pleurodeles waltl TaxID=8319 RepID=A0AAV7WW78_PLEWA|nr:hypothetical protein NDU88_004574 [Pleurodeles waltl]